MRKIFNVVILLVSVILTSPIEANDVKHIHKYSYFDSNKLDFVENDATTIKILEGLVPNKENTPILQDKNFLVIPANKKISENLREFENLKIFDGSVLEGSNGILMELIKDKSVFIFPKDKKSAKELGIPGAIQLTDWTMFGSPNKNIMEMIAGKATIAVPMFTTLVKKSKKIEEIQLTDWTMFGSPMIDGLSNDLGFMKVSN